MRHGGRPPLRVLELGCGVGANVPFFLARGDDYAAVEGSPSAVAEVRRRFPELRERIVAADFTSSLPDGPFDLIVDRAALTHNTTAAIGRALAAAQAALRPGGRFIGVDWFSTSHADAARGTPLDAHTRDAAGDGQFAELGAVHFSDEPHLRALFSAWEIVALEHKIVASLLPAPRQFAAWNIVARRPAGGD